MKKKIIFLSSIIAAIVLMTISTIVFILNQDNEENYFLNENKPYTLNEYNKIVDDIYKIHNDNLFLINSRFTMHINEKNEIVDVALKFTNEDSSKLYYFRISDNKNKLKIWKNEGELTKITTIKDYFNICYLGTKKINSEELWICSMQSIELSIGNYPNQYIYDNEELVKAENEIPGSFFEFEFYNNTEKLLYVYINR